jgi:hypothetical protein
MIALYAHDAPTETPKSGLDALELAAAGVRR